MKKFYEAVRIFYERAYEYAIANLPLNDDVLQSARILNPETQLNSLL